MTLSDGLVVVVDDDDGMRVAIQRVLLAAGLRALTFGSAEALLDHVMPAADCMVVDVHLPGISGYELIDALALRGAVPPVVFISSHQDSATVSSMARAGRTSQFLAKPFTGAELLECIEALLNVRRPSLRP